METEQAVADCSLEMILEELNLRMLDRPTRSIVLQSLGRSKGWKKWCGRKRGKIAASFGLVITDSEVLLLEWQSGRSVSLTTAEDDDPSAVPQIFLKHRRFKRIPWFVEQRAEVLCKIAINDGTLTSEYIQLCRTRLTGTLLGAMLRQAFGCIPSSHPHYAV